MYKIIIDSIGLRVTDLWVVNKRNNLELETNYWRRCCRRTLTRLDKIKKSDIGVEIGIGVDIIEAIEVNVEWF